MNDKIARYMLFNCGERRYAVDVEAVDEISEMLAEHLIPDSPRFLRGVVNIHGKIAALLDLSMYLGTGQVKNGRNLLLLKIPETCLALIVTQMERIIFDDDIIASDPGSSEFEKAVLTLADGRVSLLELNSLVLSIEKALAL
ncbi:MAG: chemotaxis protein CheW [Geobacteraceae bacterium]|nr:chemotaxis protein CheW [Geobacteraceae bacterium]